MQDCRLSKKNVLLLFVADILSNAEKNLNKLSQSSFDKNQVVHQNNMVET